MDPNNVVATAQQAVLSSADQVSAEAGATSKHGSASSSQTSSKDAASIRDETSGNGGPSNSKRGSAANGAEKTNATTEASAGGNDGAREEGELSGSRSDSPARQDDDEDAEGVEDYMLEGDAGEMSFVIDTAGDMDVDREIALEGEAKADNVETHIESGLLLPSHVNVIPQADNSASKAGSSAAGPSQNAPAGEASDNEGLEDFEGDMGDFEQLDMDPSTANRYYGAEEKAERRAKEQCLACGDSPAAGPSSRSRGGDSERLVSFDRTKAVESEGGFLTRKEKKKGKTPLPEHLFRQWVRDRHDYPEHADEIRAALEKRAELESKGLDTKSVPSTREIVGDLAGKRGSKRSNDSDSRPSKKRKGDSFSDPVVVDSDDDPDAYRNDGTFSDSDSGSDSDDNAGGRRKKRRGDGKNNRRGRPQKDSAAPHTGWGHAGDGGSGSKGGGPKRGKFSRHNQERRSKPYERDNGASGTNGGGKRRGRRGNGGGGSNNNNGGAGGRGGDGGGGGNPKYNGGGGGGGGGGEKVRGGGSKYRGGYF
ncbi:hypothetical protein NDA16_001128 [Ustilago loliicola]|nr:hypothetical protein NDA16_001128 [Ustilago loliicola]